MLFCLYLCSAILFFYAFRVRLPECSTLQVEVPSTHVSISATAAICKLRRSRRSSSASSVSEANNNATEDDGRNMSTPSGDEV